MSHYAELKKLRTGIRDIIKEEKKVSWSSLLYYTESEGYSDKFLKNWLDTMEKAGKIKIEGEEISWLD